MSPKRRVYWSIDILTESINLLFTNHGFIIVASNWRQHCQFLNLAFLWFIQHKDNGSQGIISFLISCQEPIGQCCGNSSLNINLKFPTNSPISSTFPIERIERMTSTTSKFHESLSRPHGTFPWSSCKGTLAFKHKYTYIFTTAQTTLNTTILHNWLFMKS
jgi:hypothetical protein